MELNGAKILYTIHTDIPLLGDLKITQTLVTTWIVMALLSGLAIWLGSNLKLENVSKRQAAAEFIVERLEQFVHDNMGYHFDKYIPLIGSIFALSIGCNLISVIGLWSRHHQGARQRNFRRKQEKRRRCIPFCSGKRGGRRWAITSIKF